MKRRGKPRVAWASDRRRGEIGSATVWVICVLMLISAAAGWALTWVAAQGSRHSVERAADAAALAAAQQALHRLATQSGQEPCVSASQAALRAGAELTACDCTPLDCTVSVSRQFAWIGALPARIPGVGDLGPVRATSKAGPVGESAA
jgi:secretion/DNA translocation related TadE-like protein